MSSAAILWWFLGLAACGGRGDDARAPETLCNGVDDDGDGHVDEGARSTWFLDRDRDGYGDPASEIRACEAAPGLAPEGTDCDDADGALHPAAVEICNGIDDDCDGRVDADAADAPTWYGDGDGDGSEDSSVAACSEASGWVANHEDCDDTDPDLNPDTVWYADADADGYGDPSRFRVECEKPSGYVLRDDDCDDRCHACHPGGTETWDSVDDDCDGVIDDVDTIDTDPPAWTWTAPSSGACDALVDPWALSAVADAEAAIRQADTRLVDDGLPWTDFADLGLCPDYYGGANYVTYDAHGRCKTSAGARLEGLDYSGFTDATWWAGDEDYYSSWRAYVVGTAYMAAQGDALEPYNLEESGWEKLSYYYADTRGSAGWPLGEQVRDLTWEGEDDGRDDVIGYVYVVQDFDGGATGDFCIDQEIAVASGCPDEGDGTVTITGTVDAVVTFDGSTSCDGCGEITIDGVDMGLACP